MAWSSTASSAAPVSVAPTNASSVAAQVAGRADRRTADEQHSVGPSSEQPVTLGDLHACRGQAAHRTAWFVGVRMSSSLLRSEAASFDGSPAALAHSSSSSACVAEGDDERRRVVGAAGGDRGIDQRLGESLRRSDPRHGLPPVRAEPTVDAVGAQHQPVAGSDAHAAHAEPAGAVGVAEEHGERCQLGGVEAQPTRVDVGRGPAPGRRCGPTSAARHRRRRCGRRARRRGAAAWPGRRPRAGRRRRRRRARGPPSTAAARTAAFARSTTLRQSTAPRRVQAVEQRVDGGPRRECPAGAAAHPVGDDEGLAACRRRRPRSPARRAGAARRAPSGDAQTGAAEQGAHDVGRQGVLGERGHRAHPLAGATGTVSGGGAGGASVSGGATVGASVIGASVIGTVGGRHGRRRRGSGRRDRGGHRAGGRWRPPSSGRPRSRQRW